MPDTARDEILARVRAAIADRPEVPAVPRDYDTAREYPDLLGLAEERITDYRAQVSRATEATLPAVLADILRAWAPTTMVAAPGVPTAWQVEGPTWLADEPPLTVDQLDAADGVLTGCAVVIAETGTVVLDTGTTQGRRALILLPDHHLCVAYEHQVVATVPEALHRLGQRPLTFISGPSATSDIELERVEGVHGPRHLHVVLVAG